MERYMTNDEKTSLLGTNIVPSTVWSAGAGCHGGCGIDLHIKDDKLVMTLARVADMDVII